MFRRREINLPKDPVWPHHFPPLGFTITADNRIVKMADLSGADTVNVHFDYYHTDNERSNDKRREAAHNAARKEVYRQLEKLGTKILYLSHDAFEEKKPPRRHVPILITDIHRLKYKKDVVIVVNEAKQDLGIWSYRYLMRNEGIDIGSAVGLAKKLKHWPKRHPSPDTKTARSRYYSKPMNSNSPGLIILNPGALLYSYAHETTFTQESWLALSKENAIQDHVRIDPEHNFVPGHKTPADHVRTVFDTVIPHVTRSDARFYIVGISDGAEAMLHYLDDLYATNPHDQRLRKQVVSMALIQPNHNDCDLKDKGFKRFLASSEHRVKSWIFHPSIKDELVATPKLPAETEAETAVYNPANDRSSPAVVVRPSPLNDNGHRRKEQISRSPSDDSTMLSVMTGIDLSTMSGLNLKSLSKALPATEAASPPIAAHAASAPSKRMASLPNFILTSSSSPECDIDEDPNKDYAFTEPVSCPTFSSGIEGGAIECIFPLLIDDILSHFAEVKDVSDMECHARDLREALKKETKQPTAVVDEHVEFTQQVPGDSSETEEAFSEATEGNAAYMRADPRV